MLLKNGRDRDGYFSLRDVTMVLSPVCGGLACLDSGPDASPLQPAHLDGKTLACREAFVTEQSHVFVVAP